MEGGRKGGRKKWREYLSVLGEGGGLLLEGGRKKGREEEREVVMNE